MHALVYLLCAATTFACAILLLRGFRRSKARLLLWSGVFFFAITMENLLLYVDFIVFPDVSLMWIRLTLVVVGLCLLIGSMIAERV